MQKQWHVLWNKLIVGKLAKKFSNQCNLMPSVYFILSDKIDDFMLLLYLSIEEILHASLVCVRSLMRLLYIVLTIKNTDLISICMCISWILFKLYKPYEIVRRSVSTADGSAAPTTSRKWWIACITSQPWVPNCSNLGYPVYLLTIVTRSEWYSIGLSSLALWFWHWD
jgi:hypothetical protein